MNINVLLRKIYLEKKKQEWIKYLQVFLIPLFGDTPSLHQITEMGLLFLSPSLFFSFWVKIMEYKVYVNWAKKEEKKPVKEDWGREALGIQPA